MRKDSDQDGPKRGAQDPTAAPPGDKRSRGPDPGETSDMGVSASADPDDADVLRTVLASIDQGRVEVRDVLVQLGPDFFSEQGGWRRLFLRLVDAPASVATFKRRALADYLVWLESSRADPPADAAQDPSHQPTDSSSLPDSNAQLTKLVRGQPTRLRFDGDNRIECRLGHCILWIEAGTPPRLAITGQRSIALGVGFVRVGRAKENEVVLGERWPDVSRRHLLIEVTSDRHVVLTDLSSHGTFVTPSAV